MAGCDGMLVKIGGLPGIFALADDVLMKNILNRNIDLETEIPRVEGTVLYICCVWS